MIITDSDDINIGDYPIVTDQDVVVGSGDGLSCVDSDQDVVLAGSDVASRAEAKGAVIIAITVVQS